MEICAGHIVEYLNCFALYLISEYTVEVETSNAMDAGTDHIGWIIIKGRHGMSPVLQLRNPDGGRTLQRGHLDKFR